MEPLRYGVIGVGGTGKHHLYAALQNRRARVTALSDVDEDLLRLRGAGLDATLHRDYREMLKGDRVDAVSIAVPHHLSAPIAIDCLNAGVHVFVEKPMATRVSQADTMIAIARRKGLKIGVAYQYRTFRLSEFLKQLIESGELGGVLQVLWTWNEFRPESYFGRHTWRTSFTDAGGGILLNQASHDLDLIRWLIGSPREASALAARQIHSARTEDTVSAAVVFENGAIGSLQFSINRPRAFSVRQITGERGIVHIPGVASLTGDRNEEILFGAFHESLRTSCRDLQGTHDQPSLRWERRFVTGGEPLLRKLCTPRTVLGKLGILKRTVVRRDHGGLIDNFIDAVLSDREPLVNGEAARGSLELINGLMLSAFRKKTVSFPIDGAEYDELFDDLTCGKVAFTGGGEIRCVR